MTESTELPDEARFQALLAFRGRLDDLRISQHTTFDKTLVTLSTGVIGLSALLFQWIAERGEITGTSLIVGAWASLWIGLLCNLASYLTSARDAANEIEHLDREIISGVDEDRKRNIFRLLTRSLNIISLICFALGTAATFVFVYLNTAGV